MKLKQSLLMIIAAGMVISSNMNPFVECIMDQMEECRENQTKKNRFFKFFYMIERNNIQRTKEFLDKCDQPQIYINAQDVYGLTSLHQAASRGHTKTVELLLDYKADVNAQDKFGLTPLHQAELYNHTETVNLLLDYKANINAQDAYGLTPLHWAAIRGHTKTAKLLLDRGAKVNAESIKGKTPLNYAIGIDIAKLLLDNGADPTLVVELYFLPHIYINSRIEMMNLLEKAKTEWKKKHNKQTPPSAPVAK